MAQVLNENLKDSLEDSLESLLDSELKDRVSLEEYIEMRINQDKGTGRLTSSAVSNAELFCQEKYHHDLVTVLDALREKVLSTRDFNVRVCVVFLQKFVWWMAEPHLDLHMNPNQACKNGKPCVAKDRSSIKGYVGQIRLVMNQVGGIPISSSAVKDSQLKFPPPSAKEEPEPMTLEEFRLICDNQKDPRRQMLYRCKKDFEARIGAMVQLRKRDFDTTGYYESKGEIPITVTFPAHIMKKKNGISFTNKKYVIKEDEEGVIKLLGKINDDDLVFGTTENVDVARSNEEKTWSRLVQSLGFTARYKHNNHLKKNIHSIKSLTFTAARKAVDSDYANAYGDHAAYCKTYLRLSDEEKIDYFRRLEPYISMYKKIVKIHDSEQLYQENKELKKKLTDVDAKLEVLAEDKMSQEHAIPDEKMQEMFDNFMKNKENSEK